MFSFTNYRIKLKIQFKYLYIQFFLNVTIGDQLLDDPIIKIVLPHFIYLEHYLQQEIWFSK